MTQLTNPVPTYQQIWSWKRNLEGGLALFAVKRNEAIRALSQSGRSYTARQLTLESVARWNGGAYHRWDGRNWVRNPDMLCASGTGNIGWDMTDTANQGQTLQQLQARDSSRFHLPPRRASIIIAIREFAMRTGWCPEMRRLMLLSILAIGACGTPQSDANALPETGNTVDAITPPAATDIVPMAAKRDDRLTLPGGVSIPVRLDETTVARDAPRNIKVLARHGSLIALSDTYTSKPQALGRCQAGEETWFRVIDTKAPAERYARLVDSCLTSRQWGDPPITVSSNGATITLNLLSEPPVTLPWGNDSRVVAK